MWTMHIFISKENVRPNFFLIVEREFAWPLEKTPLAEL